MDGMMDRFIVVPFEEDGKWGFVIRNKGTDVARVESTKPKTLDDERIARGFAEDKAFEMQHPNGGLLTKYALSRSR